MVLQCAVVLTLGQIVNIVPTVANSRRESAVQASDGYFVSSMGEGTITKYKFDGTQDAAWGPISSLNSPRGLAITQDKKRLFVADDDGVAVYDVDPAPALKNRVVASQAARKNGLCLSADDTKLFVTDSGWKLWPYGAEGTNKGVLLQIDVGADGSLGAVTTVFTGRADQSPNGCTVVGNTVWMANQKDSVTSYNMATGVISGSASFAANILTYQTSNQAVGDGMVAYEGALFVSTWHLGGGVIHKCNLTTGAACVEVAQQSAADMQVRSVPKIGAMYILPALGLTLCHLCARVVYARSSTFTTLPGPYCSSRS
jgi:hypothetical protein